MAKIPDMLPLEGPQGASEAGLQPIRPTDFGLGQAAQTLEGVAAVQQRAQMQKIRAQAQADRLAVQPLVEKLTDLTGDQLTNDAAQWNHTPGFAADQISKARAKAEGIVSVNSGDLTSGQIAEFNRQANLHIAAFGTQAHGYEREQLMRDVGDQQLTVLNGAKSNFFQAYAPARQALADNNDGHEAGYGQAVMQAFDAAAAPALEGVPDGLKPRAQAEFAAMRAEEMAKASAEDQQRRDAFVHTNLLAQADAGINAITSNPAAYSTFVSNIMPGIVAAAPAGLDKKGLARELQGKAAQAQVEALIRSGKAPLAKDLMDGGSYDGLWEPAVKANLEAQATAGVMSVQPTSQQQAVEQGNFRQAMAANLKALAQFGVDTGQAPLDAAARIVGGSEAASYQMAQTQVLRTYAAAGGVRNMTATQLEAMRSAPPPAPGPDHPNYAADYQAWEALRDTADEEVKARAQPGAWAFDTTRAQSKGGAASAGPMQRGDQLRAALQAVQAGGPGGAAAGASYANQMLGVQYQAQVPAAQRQIVPQDVAATMASEVVRAPPEQKLAALANVAGFMRRLPGMVTLPDGSSVSPQAMLGRQLQWAGMSAADFSAIADFGGPSDQAKLARVVSAEQLATKLPPNSKAQLSLTADVRKALAVYQGQIAPLAGARDLAEAQIARTALVAHSLMVTQNLDQKAAVKSAAEDLTGGYVYRRSYRIPFAVATGGTGWDRFSSMIDGGAQQVLGQLLVHPENTLPGPTTYPGSVQERQKHYADQISAGGFWANNPDGSGLMLMTPRTDGGADQVRDIHNRPVTATWDQLKNPHSVDYSRPPPFAPRLPDGRLVPATSRAGGQEAFEWALEQRESGGRSGLVSASGALGVRQVLPDTAAPYAQRLFGQPLDVNRLQHDDGYNRAISHAILGDLIQHYGTGSGMALVAAGYFAGPKNVDRMVQAYGDPRSQVSVDEWVKRIEAHNPKTAAYVPGVLWPAMRRMAGN